MADASARALDGFGTQPTGSTVYDLVEYLFKCFPEDQAEDWDKCGLLVGNGNTRVTGVAIALDPNVATIEHARDLRCNVLLTHHPAYIDAPQRFVDRKHGGSDAAARVVSAIRNEVALVAMHTNLDRSPLAAQALIASLGLDYVGRMIEDREPPAFGWLASPRLGDAMNLKKLVIRCQSSYGIIPRVWGDRDMEISTVAIANGSSSSLVGDIVESCADCLVTGEISYHNACEVASNGVGIIELGHDVSEFPLLECLRKALESTDAFGNIIKMIGPDLGWWQPGMEIR